MKPVVVDVATLEADAAAVVAQWTARRDGSDSIPPHLITHGGKTYRILGVLSHDGQVHMVEEP